MRRRISPGMWLAVRRINREEACKADAATADKHTCVIAGINVKKCC